jgi:hypothetical protein
LNRILLLFIFLIGGVAQAQHSGVKGTIKADDGSSLSFATIFVKQLGTGTTANEDGNYEIQLAPGRYELVYQHLGRKTAVRVVEVKNEFVEINITLNPQDILLQTVEIDGNEEDPAYTIMRKAIAKANYHRNLLDSYSARVYIKGAGKLKDYPWLAKKQLQKEGIEKNRVYISESVSDIKFTRPNKFEERTITLHPTHSFLEVSMNRKWRRRFRHCLQKRFPITSLNITAPTKTAITTSVALKSFQDRRETTLLTG